VRALAAGGAVRAPVGRLSRRRLLAGASVGAAVGLSSACHQAGTSPRAGSASSPAQPKDGGTLNLRLANEIATWNASLERSIYVTKAIRLAYDSLLGYQSGPETPYDKYVLEPRLAQRWEIPDQQTYILHLRDGVTFQHLPPVNGRPFVASDVKWSLEFLSTTGPFKTAGVPTSVYKSDFLGMDAIQTPDDSTVTVHFQQSFAPFLNYLGSERLPMLPHEIWDQDHTLADLIVGTGPYQLDGASSIRNQRYVWRRNPAYWEHGKPHIDTLNWLMITDDSSGYAAFEANRVDMITDNIQAPQMHLLKKDRPDSQIQRLDAGTMNESFNVSRPPLNDLRVRKAISLGVDREEMIRVVGGGEGRWGVPNAAPDDFTLDELKQMLPYDPQQAKQLLSATGVADITLETLWCTDCYGTQFQTLMQLMQAQLKQIGINLRLRPVDSPTANQSSAAHDYTMRGTLKAPQVDMDGFIYDSFYPGDPQNYGRVDDPPLTALLDSQRVEFDPARRRDLWRQIERRINGEMYWMLSLYIANIFAVWHPRLRNFGLNASTNGWPLENAWLAS